MGFKVNLHQSTKERRRLCQSIGMVIYEGDVNWKFVIGVSKNVENSNNIILGKTGKVKKKSITEIKLIIRIIIIISIISHHFLQNDI